MKLFKFYVTFQVKAGEVLAFDYRVLHRALSHKGTENRPMLYYTYTKRWFSDAMNFADLPSLHMADAEVNKKKSGIKFSLKLQYFQR